jgi:hypothetical protein
MGGGGAKFSWTQGRKIPKYGPGDTTDVESEIYDYTSYNWSHWNSNENLRKNLEAIAEKHSIDSLQKTAILEHHK